MTSDDRIYSKEHEWVMIEGNDDDQVKSWAGRVAEVFRREIGEEG